jgi:NADPH:quinone reductase-like Zn-dependent oxidoreductase
MRAATINEYGTPDQFVIQQLPDPPCGPDDVIVRVLGAGVNPVDTKIRQGYLAGAFVTHFPLVIGWDVSGVVEKVGPAIEDWQEGDEVFGYVRKDSLESGAYAERISVPYGLLAAKPSSLSHSEAAAVPLAGLTAYQTLIDKLHLQPGQTLLVLGAAGGVGTFAVQLAKSLGATVIGTSSPHSFSYLEGLGVDECLDYHVGPASEQLRHSGHPNGVDAVLDLRGGDVLADGLKALNDTGQLVSVIDPAVKDLGGHYMFVHSDLEHLVELTRLIEDGSVTVPVEAAFTLEQVARAHQLMENGHVHGKVVLTVL